MHIKILRDMDGVAADWRKYVLKNHFPGMDINELNRHPERFKLLGGMYRAEPDLFHNLPVMDGFREFNERLLLLKKILANDGHTLKLGWLTAGSVVHPSPEEVIRSKKNWIVKNKLDDEDYPKHFYAAETSSDKKAMLCGILAAVDAVVLIDDFKRNVDDANTIGTRSSGIHHKDNFTETFNNLKRALATLGVNTKINI